jgi:zinc protease
MRIQRIGLAALTVMAVAAQTLDRTKEPQTPPIPEYRLPPIYETKLPNGLDVVVVEDRRFPLVTARLLFQAGSKFDPKDLPGLSEAVAALLNEGTRTRTSRQISEQTDAIGGSLSGSSGPDVLTLSGRALSENFRQLMTLMADCARNATFPESELNLHKQNRIQALRAEKSDPGFLAAQKMAEVLYGSSPYAHIAPTEAAIAKLDSQRLADFRDSYLVPNNATLILLGKLPARSDLMKVLNAEFGDWKKKALPPAPKIDLPAPKRQIVLVDRPGSVQADIHIGRLAPTRLTPDYFPLMVAHNVLGGGASSRLFMNIREKEGFAYDAHTEYNTRRDAADLEAVTEVRNDVLEPALKAALAEMENMTAKPVPEAELNNVKNYRAGLYLLGMETQDGLANQLSTVKTLGLSNDYLEKYVSRVRSVQPSQILEVAKKYIAPEQSAIVVVGDAAKIGDVLRKFGEVAVTKAN